MNPEYHNPQPKQKRIRLKGKAYTIFRKTVHEMAGGKCQTCGGPAPLMVNGVFNEYLCGHVSHLRHGSNKEDVLGAVIWEDFKCHSKRNSPKWTTNTKA